VKKFSVNRLLLVAIFIWLASSVWALPQVSGAAGPTAGNPANGKLLFEKRCTGCHSLDKNKEGPRLRGVYGRRAGSVQDFSYSDELKSANITWDEVSLDKWLINPEGLVANSDMAFHISSAEERADIIQFLRLSSGN
jgi:cytochrome c